MAFVVVLCRMIVCVRGVTVSTPQLDAGRAAGPKDMLGSSTIPCCVVQRCQMYNAARLVLCSQYFPSVNLPIWHCVKCVYALIVFLPAVPSVCITSHVHRSVNQNVTGFVFVACAQLDMRRLTWIALEGVGGRPCELGPPTPQESTPPGPPPCSDPRIAAAPRASARRRPVHSRGVPSGLLPSTCRPPRDGRARRRLPRPLAAPAVPSARAAAAAGRIIDSAVERCALCHHLERHLEDALPLAPLARRR